MLHVQYVYKFVLKIYVHYSTNKFMFITVLTKLVLDRVAELTPRNKTLCNMIQKKRDCPLQAEKDVQGKEDEEGFSVGQ
jgi:hypothetical protein